MFFFSINSLLAATWLYHAVPKASFEFMIQEPQIPQFSIMFLFVWDVGRFI